MSRERKSSQNDSFASRDSVASCTSSLFWYYRALAALRCGPFVLDDRRDIVPVDYVADALRFLLMCERPRCGGYHVSAGASASELRSILALFTGHQGDVHDWSRVSAAELATMRPEIEQLVANQEEGRKLARGLEACARFGELGVQWFDNSRLLAEGFRPPPRFVDYLDLCLRTSGDATIFEQMIDDA